MPLELQAGNNIGSMTPEYPDRASNLNRAIAIAEVTGISVVGNVLTYIGLSLLGPEFKLQSILNSGSDIDFLRASLILTTMLVVQYTFLLVPAFIIGRWYRRRSLKEYGLTKNSQSIIHLVKLGVGTFALAFFPTTLMRLAREYLPLGRLPLTQDLVSTLDWSQ